MSSDEHRAPPDRFSMADDLIAESLEHEAQEAAPAGGPGRLASRLLVSRDLAILAVAVVLFLFFTAANPRFASPNVLIDIARRVAPLGIMAVGVTWLFISGEIDLSVGANFGLAMVVLAILIEKRDWNPWVALALMLAVGVAIGLVNGMLVTLVGLPSFIATLGMWVALRGVANVFSGGISTNATRTDLDYYLLFQSNLPGTRVPTIFLMMLVVMAVGALILARTKFGSDIYATGGDAESARNNGIATRRIKMLCFAIAGGLCAFAGAMQFGRIANAPVNAGGGIELQVIAAVIIGGVGLFGGRGTVLGSLIGVLILAMLSSGLVLIGVTEFWDGIVSGLVILAAAGLDLLVRRGSMRTLERGTA